MPRLRLRLTAALLSACAAFFLGGYPRLLDPTTVTSGADRFELETVTGGVVLMTLEVRVLIPILYHHMYRKGVKRREESEGDKGSEAWQGRKVKYCVAEVLCFQLET